MDSRAGPGKYSKTKGWRAAFSIIDHKFILRRASSPQSSQDSEWKTISFQFPALLYVSHLYPIIGFLFDLSTGIMLQRLENQNINGPES